MRSKSLLVSVIVAIICAAVITAVCVVLLLPEETGEHIKIEDNPTVEVNRGELEIKLIRERLDYIILDKRGSLTEDCDEKSKDFSKSNENIFGITSDILVGPGCYFSAAMLISNVKGYSFEYWLEITPEDAEHLLAEQLEMTVSIGEEVLVKRTLGSGLLTEPLLTVNNDEQSRFTVKLEYLNVDNNDETQNATLAFDMVVHARLV